MSFATAPGASFRDSDKVVLERVGKLWRRCKRARLFLEARSDSLRQSISALRAARARYRRVERYADWAATDLVRGCTPLRDARVSDGDARVNGRAGEDAGAARRSMGAPPRPQPDLRQSARPRLRRVTATRA